MKIYTTYFAKLKKLPGSIVPVAICLYPPPGWLGLSCKQLAPRNDVFREYKVNSDFNTFTDQYITTTLESLRFSDVFTYLNQCSQGKDIALVCFEKNPHECHRSIVAAWFEYNGHIVEEWSEV